MIGGIWGCSKSRTNRDFWRLPYIITWVDPIKRPRSCERRWRSVTKSTKKESPVMTIRAKCRRGMSFMLLVSIPIPGRICIWYPVPRSRRLLFIWKMGEIYRSRRRKPAIKISMFSRLNWTGSRWTHARSNIPILPIAAHGSLSCARNPLRGETSDWNIKYKD